MSKKPKPDPIIPIVGIIKIVFLEEYYCFQKNEEICLRPGLNVLVGDQGVGKSTLIGAITDGSRQVNDNVTIVCNENVHLRGFDFEKDNPRLSALGGRRGTMRYGDQINMMCSSHGESQRSILESIQSSERDIICLDEPDSSLSMRSCYNLCKLFDKVVAQGCQIIASIHNPILITHAKEVLSLEHRRWMSSEEFIELMQKPKQRKVRS